MPKLNGQFRRMIYQFKEESEYDATNGWFANCAKYIASCQMKNFETVGIHGEKVTPDDLKKWFKNNPYLRAGYDPNKFRPKLVLPPPRRTSFGLRASRRSSSGITARRISETRQEGISGSAEEKIMRGMAEIMSAIGQLNAKVDVLQLTVNQLQRSSSSLPTEDVKPSTSSAGLGDYQGGVHPNAIVKEEPDDNEYCPPENAAEEDEEDNWTDVEQGEEDYK